MNRRDLFNLSQFPQILGELAGQLGIDQGQASEKPTELIKVARRAMATQFEVFLPLGIPNAISIGEFALDCIDRWEDKLTVYRDTSEISRLNQTAFNHGMEVDPRIFNLLQFATAISDETYDAFDITQGKLIKSWGFFRGPKRVPSSLEIEQILHPGGSKALAFDQKSNQITFLSSKVELNLGAIGKGFALDQAASELTAKYNLHSFLMHGGKSSILAGVAPREMRRGWQIAIQHPWEDKTLGSAYLNQQALGISAATFQHFHHEGKKYGHILDPRTGFPAKGVASCVVSAPNATLADALSTAFFILGKEAASEFCKNHENVGVLILPEDSEENVFVIGKMDIDL